MPDSEARWLVAGRVQGVGFRWFVRGAAARLGIRGDVRNLADGRVEVRAQGDARNLALLLEELKRGPDGSRVDGVESVAVRQPSAFDRFEIRG